MPNYCSFDMLIVTQNTADLNKLIAIIGADYSYTKDEDNGPYVESNCEEGAHLFRVLEAIPEEYSETRALIQGYCAWSVFSCMLDQTENSYYKTLEAACAPGVFKGATLLELSQKYNASIEVFTQETGVGFAEHYLILEGELVVDECVELEEVYNSDTDEWEAIGGFDINFSI